MDSAPVMTVRDAAFARRLEQSCDSSPHCPPMHHGRLTWIVEQLKKEGQSITVQTAARWMNGEAKPRQSKNTMLAKVLGVDPVWLYMGVESDITPRERKSQSAMADGVVSLVAGLIKMDGGSVSFPEEGSRARREHVDITAIIKAGTYNMHVALAEAKDGAWAFKFPIERDEIVILGVVRQGFSVRIVEIGAALIEEHGNRTSGGRAMQVVLSDEQIDAVKLEGFTQGL